MWFTRSAARSEKPMWQHSLHMAPWQPSPLESPWEVCPMGHQALARAPNLTLLPFLPRYEGKSQDVGQEPTIKGTQWRLTMAGNPLSLDYRSPRMCQRRSLPAWKGGKLKSPHGTQSTCRHRKAQKVTGKRWAITWIPEERQGRGLCAKFWRTHTVATHCDPGPPKHPDPKSVTPQD